mmetsp:Transcript_20782/g.30721  ORF Transcript_20782/g.30721 Transcript_20782/m.30721 type:complete len:248 (-) Transcript_20782:194-937(-)
MGLFRKSKKDTTPGAPTAPPQSFTDPTASITPGDTISRQGEQIIASSNQGKFRPSDVYDSSLHDPESQGYKHKRASTVPTAKESAFSGPVRYDWVDVESAAAIKVQSIFRRNQALGLLEKEGRSTSDMRNKIRMREAKKNGKVMASEDTPAILRFCGIGMLFGDATGEDADALNSKNELGLQKLQQKEAKESKKRLFRMRKKSTDQIEEAIEVVDNIDLGEGDEQVEEPVQNQKSGKGKFRFRKSKA